MLILQYILKKKLYVVVKWSQSYLSILREPEMNIWLFQQHILQTIIPHKNNLPVNYFTHQVTQLDGKVNWKVVEVTWTFYS